jgi:IMP dehydrogenase
MEVAMRQDKFGRQGLTFDDVLLVPAYSHVLPRDVDISTKLTRHIGLNIPILSAGMDTVTESTMAIAMAREGGLGVIHKNMSIDEQARQVKEVKRAEHGVVAEPLFLSPEDTLADVDELMNKYHISGIPITEEGKLVGIITNRDMRFETDLFRPISEVMTKKDLVTAPENTTLEEARKILQAHRIEKLPLVDEEGYLKGLITVKDIEQINKYPHAARDGGRRLLAAAAIGISEDVEERVEALLDVKTDVFILDTAHAHSEGVLETLRRLKKDFPHLEIIAGNVSTYDGAKALIEAGADGIKVGNGSGSSSTTRVVTGIGVPQITAIYDCARAVEGTEVPIIADGGIRYAGDVPKALAAGASSVMIGNLFAGTEESPGETIIYQGKRYKAYRGMASLGAMHAGSKGRYFRQNSKRMVPEGIEGAVPYKGHVSDVLSQLMGGLRAAMGYCGTATIKAMNEEAQFIQITGAGLRESRPHDVNITKEAPNYSTK